MRRILTQLLATTLLTAAVWTAGQYLIERQGQAIVQKLTDEIQHGSPSEAIAAIKQLSKMNEVGLNEAGIDELLDAAANPQPRIAPAARWAVEDLLTAWQEDTALSETDRIGRLAKLSSALAEKINSYRGDGKSWARGIAMKTLESLAALSAGGAVQIVHNCDIVLYATRDTVIVSSQPPRNIKQQTTTKPLPQQRLASNAQAALPLVDIPLPVVNTEPQSVADLPQNNSQASSAPLREEDGSSWEFLGSPAVARPIRQPTSSEQTGFAAKQLPLLPQQQDRVKEPRRFEPRQSATADVSPQSPLPLAYKTRLLRKLAEFSDRQLLMRWAESPTTEQPVVQEELRRRGLDLLPVPLIQMMTSTDPAERIKSIDSLLRSPGVNPGRWLIALADDVNPDVRLEVVRMLVTSNDPKLLDKAWQVALHDEDPRIAKLARTLQARRDGQSLR